MASNQAEDKNQIDFYQKNYLTLAEYHLSSGKKVYFGDRKNRKCRFCGKNSGDTTFNMLAHALPEFIGNKTLISNDECDICNERFSRTIEDHFAKSLGLPRTLNQIRGKKGVPSFKDKNLRIDHKLSEPNLILAPDQQDDRIVVLLEDTRQISLEAKSQPYVPIAIYKCLTKMAISIMPEPELLHFEEAKQWINMETHNSESLNYPLKCYLAFTDEVKPFDGNIHTFLLKRKNTTDPVPYMIYIVAFGTCFFQIVVPCPKLDHKDKPISLEWFPLAPYTSYPYGEYKYEIRDLSSNEEVKDTFEISWKYESKS
ncbi:HNH endonuclease [Coleofasciculus sp.]|uniref:HNH endonuclease n=1 Tax=Coleofasciculus sp. TaxID=3100458 RepID=UPI0039F78A13